MNLLFTLTAYPPFIGGAQLHQHQLARQLIARHSVQVATQWDSPRTDWLMGTTLNSPETSRSYQVDGVPVQRIALSPAARRQLMPWVYAYYVLQGSALSRIANGLTTEIDPLAQGADLIHNVRIGREGLSYASHNLARKRGIPFVFTPVHHPRWGGWLHRYYHQLYRQADAVIALTESERQTLIALGVSADRVFVTGHGPVLAESADGGRFRANYHLQNFPLVLFVGQKYAYKGLGTLLAAARHVWRRLPDTRFVLIGPRTAYSRRLFAGVRDHRVLEIGVVSLQEKTDALAACDVFCLPSSQESFGGVFTEAWSMGKAVIGCNIPAVQEVVEDGVNGFLVEQSPAALAERILYLLDRADVRQRMGEYGKQKVNACYTWPRLAELTEQAYNRILNGR